MLINFCDNRFQPQIYCDKVSVDGYEASNLVSPDVFTRQRGFIAEYFIKPPVNVTVAFPCNIELYRVVIDPVVGRQKSNGFEILTCSNKVSESWLDRTTPVTPINNVMSGKHMLFSPTGKCFLRDPGVVCFQNVLHRSWGDWNTSDMEDISTYPNRRDLRHHKITSLNYVSHLTVRITSTLGGSAVSLRKLEIWGHPAISTQKSLVSRIKLLLNESSSARKTATEVKLKPETEAVPENKKIHEVIEENGVEIPQDFLDKITYEIMTLPMLLPSGENIDQSTLEKHIAAEAKWARPPGDPFTGIVFHGSTQAVPNAHLKTRIDKFLLTHSDALSHLPRSLGRTKDSAISGPSTSRLVTLVTGKGKEPQTPRDLDNTVTLVTTAKNSSANQRNKRHQNLDYVETCAKRMKKDKGTANELITHHKVDNHLVHNVTSNFILKQNSSISGSKNLCKDTKSKDLFLSDQKDSVSHDLSLKSSLDTALASTLGTLPSFTKFSQKQRVIWKGDNSQTHGIKGDNSVDAGHTNKFKCIYCDRLDNNIPLYKGGCVHLVCRTCLVTNTGKQFRCRVCGHTSNRNEMTKVHQ